MAHAVGGFLLTVARQWMTNPCTYDKHAVMYILVHIHVLIKCNLYYICIFSHAACSL